MEEFIHFGWRFLFSSSKPPAQQREQAPGAGHGKSRQLRLRKLLKPFGFPEALLNTTSKIALREIEEIVKPSGVGKRAIHSVLVADVRKHLCHRNNPTRLLLANDEERAHHFKEHFQLAEQQIIFVAEVKIKRGTAD